MATVKAGTNKTGNIAAARVDAKASLSEVRKPLYASVGVGDFAVEKLRTLPTRYSGGVKRFQGRVEGFQSQVKEIPAQVKEIPTQVKEIPTQVKDFPGTVKAQLQELSDKASALYGEFALRGEKVVTSIRKSPATEEAVKQGKVAVRQAKATRTSAQHAAEAAEKAVEDAAGKLG